MEPPALNGRGHAEDEAVVGNEEGPNAERVDDHITGLQAWFLW